MENYLPIIRWIHILSGMAWFGEVVVINFILIPAVSRIQGDARAVFVTTIFPRVFNLASVLSVTAVLSGATLFWITTDGNLMYFLQAGLRGKALLLGATLGTVLTLFHFFMENRLARKIGIVREAGPGTELDDIHLKLKIVPRLGLAVITTISISMMIGARGV